MIRASTWVMTVLLALPAAAQEDVQPTPPAPASATQPAPEQPPGKAPAAMPGNAPATAKSPDRFIPSEEISEDLSVSFPVDI